MKIKYFGKVNEFGKLKIFNQKIFKEDLQNLKNEDVELIIQKRTKRRSSEQNAYYWGCIINILVEAIKNEWGEIYSKQKAHELLKANVNYKEKINEETVEIIRITKTTTLHTTKEQEEYHENCRRFIKEFFNTETPLPNEQIQIFRE